MKSIRLSLMVCFLGLLAVALLTASLLVYRNAEQTLKAKQQAMAQLIEAQYRERGQLENARLDNALREQAQSLAGFVQVQFADDDRIEARSGYLSLHALGLMTAVSSPNLHLQAPVWLAEGVPGDRPRRPLPGEYPPAWRRPPPGERPSRQERWPSRVFWQFHRQHFWDLTLKEDRLLLPGDGQVCDYFQIDSTWGNSYPSASMAGRTFPLNPAVFASDRLVDWVFDDVMLSPNTPLRRVVLKASAVETVWPLPGRPGGPSGRRESGGGPSIRHGHGPTIYVHCAAQTRSRDAALAGLLDRRDNELEAVNTHTNDSLHDLRTRLLAISLVVFAATAAGGFWLVRLGLSPLQRVSDAVSRVSTKDFRLPLDERPMPRELRPIVEHLRGTLDLLKRAFAREKQAVADISHELRTPLAALMTTTEFALRKPRSVEQYRELLSDVHASAQQMHQIVDRLLTLARLDAGVDRLRVQSVDVAVLAQQCAGLVRPLAEARGLSLTVKSLPPGSSLTTNGAGGDGACVIHADPDKLREIVTNLLHNAIQYNRPGGSIDLLVARKNGTLVVEVQDTGIGIAPEVRDRIFERFYRADPSRGGDDLHAGLGLAIVKEYIDLMGGSIRVESTEGQGSTFRVLLPMR